VWILLSDGTLFASGPTPRGTWYKHLGTLPASFVPSALVVTADGGGAWLVSTTGGIRRYGDAPPLFPVGTVSSGAVSPAAHRVAGAAGW
jgi:hypothetical protein